MARLFVFLGFLVFATGLTGCALTTKVEPHAKYHALRLGPGSDVRASLTKAASDTSWKAAAIVSAVGSLTDSHLRFADQKEGTKKKGPFEIVSLSGMVAASGVHVHAALADGKGNVVGGHLLEGNLVYTTLEIVIVELKDHEFRREYDPATGFKELVIETRTN